MGGGGARGRGEPHARGPVAAWECLSCGFTHRTPLQGGDQDGVRVEGSRASE